VTDAPAALRTRSSMILRPSIPVHASSMRSGKPRNLIRNRRPGQRPSSQKKAVQRESAQRVDRSSPAAAATSADLFLDSGGLSEKLNSDPNSTSRSTFSHHPPLAVCNTD
jgi:hypothetical protein